LNGDNSLAPPSGERVGARGFEPVNIGLLAPALSSSREAREKKTAHFKINPVKALLT
jgi:hypothetical protein